MKAAAKMPQRKSGRAPLTPVTQLTILAGLLRDPEEAADLAEALPLADHQLSEPARDIAAEQHGHIWTAAALAPPSRSAWSPANAPHGR